MNTIEFFLLHHNRLHFEASGIHDRISDLTDEEIRCCPYNMNSIAWLLWHIARCEDVGINRLVADQSQVIDESDWQTQLHLIRRDIGTGMTATEVAELSERIDVNVLRKYCSAVARKTQLTIREHDQKDLEKIPSTLYLHQVLFNEEVIGKKDQWVADVYSNKTKGWFLGHLGLTHGKGHLGQILIIRKLQGLGSGGR
jgi:hypothetical protein